MRYLCDRQQVGLLERSRYALEGRSQNTMARRNGQLLLFDAFPIFYPGHLPFI
jgi:hypothetical protein